MTADLRRLAEQADAVLIYSYGKPESDVDVKQAILALLDKYELQVDRGNKWIEIANDWHRNAIAAERRVAALEEGLRDLWECWDTGQDDDVLDVHFQAARALLAAAPSGTAEVGDVLPDLPDSAYPPTRTAEPRTERATVLVAMSPELVEALTAQGWEFGERGPDGFHTPIVRAEAAAPAGLGER